MPAVNIHSHSVPIKESYLSGVLLAVNAIKELFILMDAPNCCFIKTGVIMNHDLYSDLCCKSDGFPRFAHTEAHPNTLAHDRTELVENILTRIARYHRSQAVLVSAMPAASLTGIQYEHITKKVQAHTHKPLMTLPPKKMDGDWLNGYADVLQVLAETIPLRRNAFRKNSVGIIGYLFDRNEGDHIGNLAELHRALHALDLDIRAVWLGGSRFHALQNIEQAEVILSFPYGRNAARIIARRTGARIIETDLPLGIQNTQDWLRTIGHTLHRKKAAARFIDQELHQVIPLIEWVPQRYFSEKSCALFSDPHTAFPLMQGLEELSIKTLGVVLLGEPDEKHRVLAKKHGPELFINTSAGAVKRSAVMSAHLGIGNGFGTKFFRGKPYLQFGFPSIGYHCLYKAPFLGFQGWVHLVNRIIEILSSDLILNPASSDEYGDLEL